MINITWNDHQIADFTSHIIYIRSFALINNEYNDKQLLLTRRIKK